MSRYFTSDWHINSTNILKYANRPYKSWQSAAINLIEQCNVVASKSDCVVHVGDLIMLSNDRHDIIEDVLDTNAYTLKDIKQQINANFITIEGNHDSGHNCDTDAKSLILDLNQNYRNVSVSHYPSYHDHFILPNDNCWMWFEAVKSYVHIHLCGNVHDKWILNYDKKKNILNVNVGVDVWDYRPVRDSRITEMLDFLFMHGKNLFNMTQPGFVAWNRDRWNKWVLKINGELAANRERRRKEKLERKGLTPEDCERRRIEAMKAKGLIN